MLRSGDLVQIRTREEILATLDRRGCLDNLPFMPEMLRFCGQRLRVSKVAHKTCDSAHFSGGRYMEDAVFLEDLRCDGSAHDGCQARCLIFWKTAWLEKLEPQSQGPGPQQPRGHGGDCTEQDLQAATRAPDAGGEPRYRCQATEHMNATVALRAWAPWHFIRDIRTRNATLRDVLRVVLLAAVWQLRNIGFGWRLANSLFEKLHRRMTGRPDPYRWGKLPVGKPTPAVDLGLQPGEIAEVLSHDEILATLNTQNRNRGMAYNSEMTPFCGKRFPVSQRVTRIIEEKSGCMLTFGNPCITLEGVYCKSHYTHYSLLCSRRITPYFREAWLKRSAAQPAALAANDSPAADRGDTAR